MKKFDRFGPIYVGSGDALERVAKVHSDLRGFLWDHWHTHRLAHAVVTFQSVFDGVPCKTSFFVEPDQTSGRWHIEVEEEIAKGRLIPGRNKFIVSTVQRQTRGKSGEEQGALIPDNADRPPDSYHLILKDKQGVTRLGL